MSELETFREEVRTWLDENCPPNMRTPKDGSARLPSKPEDVSAWCRTLADRGFTVPTWPKAYSGGDYSKEQAAVIQEEMTRIGTMNPAVSFGTMMLGPVLLEFASHEQKLEHLVPIARGEIRTDLTADDIIAYFEEGFGLADDSDPVETVRFVPDDRGEGMRWDNSLNWDVDAVPRNGQSVDLAGNWVEYSGTIKLEDLDFGDGGQPGIVGHRRPPWVRSTHPVIVPERPDGRFSSAGESGNLDAERRKTS